jgi:transposase
MGSNSDSPQRRPRRHCGIVLELVDDCRRITRRVNQLEREITTLVSEHFPELIAIPGCGALTAAKLVGEIAGIERFSSDSKLAMHAGVGPLEASSGNRQRHRLNRKGNRQLNAALHRIAVTQCRIHEPAKLFMTKKMREGKNNREALRCLKRHLVRLIFRTLTGSDASCRSDAAPEKHQKAA